MSHVCDTMVICCIDFRFQRYIRDFTETELKGKTYDLLGIAGATKDLEASMAQIDISVNLHKTNQLVIIHHEECGAYGKESSPQRHRKDLLIAQKEVLAKYPHLQVDLYYLHLDGEFEKIEDDISSYEDMSIKELISEIASLKLQNEKLKKELKS